jgi:3-oxoacyl-[acyl-carrier-protein] synthase II
LNILLIVGKGDNMRRVVITGIGIIAPNGTGKNEFWKANIEGASGISRIEKIDTSQLETKIAGEVKSFNPSLYIDKSKMRILDRFAHLGVSSAKMALDDSALDLAKINPEKIGVCVGSGLGGVLFHEEQMMAMNESGLRKANPLGVVKVMPNAVNSHISVELGLKGPNLTISTACSSGAHSIGEAFNLIRYRKADVMIAGGAEAPLTPFTFSAYNSLRVMSRKNDEPEKASRPFDKKRDGFVLAEGAGFVILEEMSHALDRDADIYSEVIGYGMNSSAYHIVIPNPEGKDMSAVMSLAIEDAGIEKKDIDYINAHGTATKANDSAETKAIKDYFGKYAFKIPISSTKSMTGHTIGAAGAIGVIASALAVKNGIIPPTINYENPDPECDLDYVPNVARENEVKTALINSFGFGGSNASIVVKKLKK